MLADINATILWSCAFNCSFTFGGTLKVIVMIQLKFVSECVWLFRITINATTSLVTIHYTTTMYKYPSKKEHKREKTVYDVP